MSGTVDRLQEKIAHLELALQELSDEHFRQQKDIEKLKIIVESILKNNIKQSDTTTIESDFNSFENERPPHY